MLNRSILIFALTLLLNNVSYAQNNSQIEDPDHNELRNMLTEVTGAIEASDYTKLVSFFHSNSIVTWPDATISKGPAEILKYLNDKSTGDKKIVESFKSAIEVDDLTKFYEGKIGVSSGKSHDSFKLTSGLDFNVNQRWSATVLKENGKWTLLSVHTSSDLFDNPIVNNFKKSMILYSVLIFIVGIIIGFFGTKFIKKV